MLKNILDKISPIFKNFYFLVSLFFLFWMSVVDSNDLFLQLSLIEKKKNLQKHKLYYEDKMLEVKNQKEALLNNADLLEKLAREKYLMKKKSEEVYIIVD